MVSSFASQQIQLDDARLPAWVGNMHGQPRNGSVPTAVDSKVTKYGSKLDISNGTLLPFDCLHACHCTAFYCGHPGIPIYALKFQFSNDILWGCGYPTDVGVCFHIVLTVGWKARSYRVSIKITGLAKERNGCCDNHRKSIYIGEDIMEFSSIIFTEARISQHWWRL